MIDSPSLFANSLWILGLAWLLASVSWARERAQTEQIRTRDVLSRPPLARSLNGSLALFCAGLAATAHRGWEKALWALTALVFTVSIWRIRDGKRPAESRDREPGPPV